MKEQKVHYRQVWDNGRPKQLHRYVMECFLERELGTDEHIHHKDHNPKNNHISNLQIMTPQEHSKYHGALLADYHKHNPYKHSDEHRKKMSRNRAGSGNPMARLSEEIVTNIRNSNETSTAIAAALGVSKTVIKQARNGRRWKHVPMPETKSGYRFAGPDSDWLKNGQSNQPKSPESHLVP